MLTDFEKEVEQLTRTVLSEYQPVAEARGLRVENRGVQVREESLSSRTSEIEIVFYRGRAIADILEFFVERHGKPQASLYEVEEWLRRELDGVTGSVEPE